MGLVDHQHAEPVAQFVHSTVGTLERRDGDGLHLSVPIPEAPDAAVVHPGQLPAPLVEQHPRRHQTDRARAHPGHRRDGGPGLSATGGQDHDASPVRQLPGVQRGGLIGPQFDVVEPSGNRSLSGHNVRKLDTSCPQVGRDLPVQVGRCAVGVDSRIPEDAGQASDDRMRVRIVEEQRSPVESNPHARGKCINHAGLRSPIDPQKLDWILRLSGLVVYCY